MTQRRAEGYAVAGCVFGDRLLGLRADASLGNIEDAAGSDRIIRVGDDLQVGQRILDLTALVEARAADDAVRDSLTDEELFEGARLGVRAVEHRDVSPFGARIRQAVDLSDNETRLVVLGVGRVQRDERSIAGGGPQVLRASSAVAGDDSVGRRQDVLSRPIVLFQQDRARAREVALELLDVADRGASKGVD